MNPESSSCCMRLRVTDGSWLALLQLSWQICSAGGSSCGEVLGSHSPTGLRGEKAPGGIPSCKC